jgi:DNA-binding NarL/FixJ family response regulator
MEVEVEDLSIMLVDDNPTFQRIVKQFLDRNPGFHLSHWARDGAEAIDLARSSSPGVILLDLGMPDMSGLEILPILRSILPKTAIIVLTLLDTSSYRKAAFEAGADGFVPKANLNQDLVSEIAAVLSSNGRRESTT